MAPRRHLVLVVDDEPSIVELLTLYLRGCGYRTLAAGNAAKAIELARRARPDIVLMGFLMPGMHGFEAAAVIAGLLPRCRIVMMSGSPRAEDLLAEYRQWGYGFELLMKPFEMQELRRALRGERPAAAAA